MIYDHQIPLHPLNALGLHKIIPDGRAKKYPWHRYQLGRIHRRVRVIANEEGFFTEHKLKLQEENIYTTQKKPHNTREKKSSPRSYSELIYIYEVKNLRKTKCRTVVVKPA